MTLILKYLFMFYLFRVCVLKLQHLMCLLHLKHISVCINHISSAGKPGGAGGCRDGQPSLRPCQSFKSRELVIAMMPTAYRTGVSLSCGV